MLPKTFFVLSQQLLNLVHQITIVERIFTLVLHNACGWAEYTLSTLISEFDQCISFENLFLCFASQWSRYLTSPIQWSSLE